MREWSVHAPQTQLILQKNNTKKGQNKYNMYKQRRAKVNTVFVVLTILVVLCSSLILSTLAWLNETYYFSDDKSRIGMVDVSLYADGTKVTGTLTENNGITTWTGNQPYRVPSGSTTREINLKARNDGTISALVRVTISVYTLENNNKRVALLNSTPTVSGQIDISAVNWVTQFPENTVACGYMFYGDPLEPYTRKSVDSSGNITSVTNSSGEADIISQITLSSLDKDKDYYIDVTLDAVAYSGNIYGKLKNNQITTADIPVTAYPFGTPETLPEDWTAYILSN